MSVAARAARFTLWRRAVMADARAKVSAPRTPFWRNVERKDLPDAAVKRAYEYAQDWAQRISRTPQLLNQGVFRVVRLGYAGAALSAYVGYRATATWEHSATLGGERAPIAAWFTVPMTTMAISACYHWTANGHEATFWRNWPRTVPGTIIGLGLIRGVIGLICPPDRSVEAEYFAWRDQEAKENRIRSLLPDEKFSELDMKAAQRLLSGIEEQHSNASTDQNGRGRQKEQHVYKLAYAQDKMNIANTKEVFDQLVVARAASLSVVNETAAYNACISARGQADKRCLLEYNLLQKATTDRLAILRSDDCSASMATAWKHFSTDLYAYDPKASISTIQLRDGAPLDAATRTLTKCATKKSKPSTTTATAASE